MQLAHRHILLGVTGSIAAYKAAYLVRELRRLGAEVRVIMSPAATQFVGVATFQALSGYPVVTTLFEAADSHGMHHIDLARWADLFLLAPTSANTVAKMSQGMADDLIATTYLACDAPVAIVPAMNRQMWEHPATQANLKLLQTRNVIVWGPATGGQACSEEGEGRMLEPQQIVTEIGHFFAAKILSGHKILITAGPTCEAIDSVRSIRNHSSGKMGFALASAASELGAEVILVCGAVALATPRLSKRIDVISAEQMYQAVMQHLPGTQMMISCAAVADYRPVDPQVSKIKSSHETINLHLVKTRDIVASVAQLPDRPFVVGFAADTDAIASNAKSKLLHKNLDIIVANQVGPEADYGFNSDDNEVTVFWRGGEAALGPAPKTLLAKQLMALFVKHFQARYSDKENHTA